jgi:hypothetical protein
LQAGAAPERVLGNFTKSLDFQSFGAQYGVRVKCNFGEGVVLYRKEKR